MFYVIPFWGSLLIYDVLDNNVALLATTSVSPATRTV